MQKLKGKAMFGLFCNLEEYVVPSILTVGTLCFVILLGYMLKFVHLPFVKCDVSTVISILEFYYLN
jgi:hypothetical protein